MLRLHLRRTQPYSISGRRHFTVLVTISAPVESTHFSLRTCSAAWSRQIRNRARAFQWTREVPEHFSRSERHCGSQRILRRHRKNTDLLPYGCRWHFPNGTWQVHRGNSGDSPRTSEVQEIRGLSPEFSSLRRFGYSFPHIVKRIRGAWRIQRRNAFSLCSSLQLGAHVVGAPTDVLLNHSSGNTGDMR